MPLVLLGVFAVAAFCIAASFAYTNTFGAMFRLLAGIFYRATVKGPLGLEVGLGFLGDAISGLDNAIRDAFAAGISGSEWAWHETIHQTALAFQSIGGAVEDVANSTDAALDYLYRHALPTAISIALNPFGTAIHYLLPTVHQLARDVARLIEHTAKPLVRVIHDQTVNQPAITRTIYRTLPGTIRTVIDVPNALIRGIDETLSATEARVGRLARTLTPAGIVGLVAAGVAALGLGWLRCSNVVRVGKQLCGMERFAVDALLAGALILFSRISLHAFATYLVGITEQLSGELLDGFTETHSLSVPKYRGYTGGGGGSVGGAAGVKPAKFTGYTGTLG